MRLKEQRKRYFFATPPADLQAAHFEAALVARIYGMRFLPSLDDNRQEDILYWTTKLENSSSLASLEVGSV
ncbi:hypothetical protein ACVIGB_000223 [Bradyrhizobium sp. USDA 4341]